MSRAAPRPSVLQALARRCRLRVPGLRQDPTLQAALQRGLDDSPLVDGFRFNLQCDSVVARHRGSTEALVALVLRQYAGWLQSFGPTTVGEPGSRPSDAAPQADGEPAIAPIAAAARPLPRLAATQGGGVGLAWASGALLLARISSPAPLLALTLLACGLPIWRRALGTLVAERRLNIDFLDGLALLVAIARRQTGTAALMAWMVHLGDTIRDHTARHSRRRIRAVLDFEVAQARRLGAGGRIEQVAAQALRRGDTVLLLAGDLVPADGQVRRGLASIDQSTVSGESVPALRRRGDAVYAGSAVIDGRVELRVTAAGADTVAARIVRILEQAPLGETRIQNHAEAFADRLVAPLLGVNVGLLALTGNLDRFLSMSIIDFGTGIRVAAPTGVLSSMVQASHRGILIKGGVHVERLARLEGIAFDKTGTLTRGRLAVVDVQSLAPRVDPDVLLGLAASAEHSLRHPVALAVVRHARRARGLALAEARDVDFHVGLGVSARVDRWHVHVGSERYLRRVGIPVRRAAGRVRQIESHGHAALLVAMDGALAGVLALADELRPEAPAVVAALRARSVREIVMLTGDRRGVAGRIAAALGIDRFHAEVLPADKADILRDLRRLGAPVAMVGDGVNDSPALALADVGIALVDGADIAREAADVVLLEAGLSRLVDAIDISRQSMAVLRQNIALTAGANTLALALALPVGWISPAATTVLSNGSALAAALNAMRPLLAGA